MPDVEAARAAAQRVAQVFMEVVPYWKGLSSKQQKDFVVEIVDEAGGLLLTVPFMQATEHKA